MDQLKTGHVFHIVILIIALITLYYVYNINKKMEMHMREHYINYGDGHRHYGNYKHHMYTGQYDGTENMPVSVLY